ncbi:ribonuclease H-like domain-containing protein [Tanacetum coccineum]
MSSLAPLILEELKVDRIVISWIFTTLSDSLQARLVVAHTKSAKEAWGLISDIVKIDLIINILTSLDAHVNDEDVVHYTLKGLPETYSQSKDLALPMDSSSPMVLMAESGNTICFSSTPQVKSWRPCFNFTKGTYHFGASCHYVHDANARVGTPNNGFHKGGGTSKNTTNELLNKLLQQLGKLGVTDTVPNTPTSLSPAVAFHASPLTTSSPTAGPPSSYPIGSSAHTGQATMLPQAFTAETLHDLIIGAWNMDTGLYDASGASMMSTKPTSCLPIIFLDGPDIPTHPVSVFSPIPTFEHPPSLRGLTPMAQPTSTIFSPPLASHSSSLITTPVQSTGMAQHSPPNDTLPLPLILAQQSPANDLLANHTVEHLIIIPDPPVNPNLTLVHPMVTCFHVGSNRPTHRLNFLMSSVSPLPKSYHDAFDDSNWQNAMLFGIWYTQSYKARLVANGSTQLKGVDVDETFMYMHQPSGFQDFVHPDYVCLLQRSLYGLKQGKDTAYLLLCVDDIVLTASFEHLLQQLIVFLQEFSMKDLGSLNYFLGISVIRDSTWLFVSQHKYATEILEWAGMVNCYPSRTHVDNKSKLGDIGDIISDL